ncbi:MAG: DUF4065 domain-containing protein [Armatimonadetes bacterium]|nr:DUF4065 domain-containing protein [Armatimonadota bacterium]
MTGSYPCEAVANWFIKKFQGDQKAITQLQLQKLVYIAHGWHLASSVNTDGIIAEAIFAWKYGPVIPRLWEEFAQFGSRPITDFATDEVDGHIFVPDISNHSPQAWEIQLLDYVYDVYGRLTGPQLIELTHKPGTPWHSVTEGGTKISSNKLINNSVIRDYYAQLLEELNGN